MLMISFGMQLHEAQLRVRHFALSLSLVERQFVITHTIRQTEIPALLDSSMANTPSVKILFPLKIACSRIFVKSEGSWVLVC
jgi:hypothetical protein